MTPASSREEMVAKWLPINDRAEREGNWRHLADFFAENIKYDWEAPNRKYEFNDRETVRETCVGAAMDPYKGWTYPYDKIVIGKHKGEVFATWWQTKPAQV